MNKQIEKILSEIAKERGYCSVLEMLADYRCAALAMVTPKHYKIELYMLVVKKLLQKRSR